ncbi:hydroxyisourate hydrolase [Pseudonocardia kujensis]|uniref:hydroxyisourate hydrolase n=1 Tax=Pseudonocardia kujensis TaxID=1128675 RepID=UPI001E2D84C4|nr:hydroxyisourate hydrolase [Pseudonocardia kujensis]MCE0767271.1 hydroxyisourate hydrolase [Pseudonocardia kujensis]
MTGISTHVLDAALGRPAAGVEITLTAPDGTTWSGTTDADGRVGDLYTGALAPGTWTAVFATGAYHAATGQEPFFPEVTISFTADPARGHHHVPLLLSPFSYTTYRGS